MQLLRVYLDKYILRYMYHVMNACMIYMCTSYSAFRAQ